MAETATAAPCAAANAATTVAAPIQIPAPRQPARLAPVCATGTDRWVFPLARRVQAQLETGVHPATHAPIHPDMAATCGTCLHAAARPVAEGAERTRCELSVSRRKGPDLLPIFPGCTSHTPRTEGSQP